MKQYLILDYETRSEADLRKVGAYEYARHPSTVILCAAWRFGTKESLREQIRKRVPPTLWSPVLVEHMSTLPELIGHVRDENVTIVAHNALFEQVITRFVLSKYVGEIW